MIYHINKNSLGMNMLSKLKKLLDVSVYFQQFLFILFIINFEFLY